MDNKDMLFIYPTDTVWGIGGSIDSPIVMDKVVEVKKISDKRPFSILFPTVAMINDYFTLPIMMTEGWMKNFFSMGTTLILPVDLLSKAILPQVNNGLTGIGIRMIEASDLDDIFKKIQSPLITSSLNLTGGRPIVSRDEAYDFFLQHCPLASFIEGQQLVPHGLPSTIVKFTDNGFKFLRQGDQYHYVRKFLGL